MKVAVEPDALRVVYSVSFGPLAALLVRREMDTDHSRTISEDEASAGAAALQDRVSSALRLEIGGRAAAAVWSEPSFEGVAGLLRTDPFTIELTARIALPEGGEAMLVLEDRYVDRHLEKSTYAASATAPASIVAAGPRRNPRSRESTVMVRETGDPVIRVFAVRARLPEPPRSGVPVWAAVAGAAALAAVAAWAIRRQRIVKG